MPVVVTGGAFRILILNPPREHGPAHVHVLPGKRAGTSEVLISLGQPRLPGQPWESVSLREIRGMKNRDVVAAVRLVHDHVAFLRERWLEIHDTR